MAHLISFVTCSMLTLELTTSSHQQEGVLKAKGILLKRQAQVSFNFYLRILSSLYLCAGFLIQDDGNGGEGGDGDGRDHPPGDQPGGDES